MLRTIADAQRAIETATIEIVDLRKRLFELEEENTRLRSRLANYAVRLRKIENGEL